MNSVVNKKYHCFSHLTHWKLFLRAFQPIAAHFSSQIIFRKQLGKKKAVLVKGSPRPPKANLPTQGINGVRRFPPKIPSSGTPNAKRWWRGDRWGRRSINPHLGNQLRIPRLPGQVRLTQSEYVVLSGFSRAPLGNHREEDMKLN